MTILLVFALVAFAAAFELGKHQGFRQATDRTAP
jgi:hypothetical protein